MKEQYQQLIADYLKGSLDEEGKNKVEELIAGGEIDFIDFRAMEQLYEEMDMVPVPEPGPEVNQRFYAMLEEEKAVAKSGLAENIKQKLRGFIIEITLPKLAYAFVLLVVGGFIGAWFNDNESEIEQLTSEMQEMKEVMVVSMLEGASATDRLKAVNISTELPGVDEKAVRALLFTLNNDPSVNVRVQTIEALKRWADRDFVREGLVRSIKAQESPIVIVELADAMLELEVKSAGKEFEQLLQERELDIAVQQKLESSIAALM